MRMAAAFLTVAISFAPLDFAMAKKQAAAVKVDPVISEPLSQTMPIIGRLVASQTGVVAALTGGPVSEVRVAVGDKVKKGDVVAKLVTDRIRWNRQLRAAAVREKQAALQAAKAQLSLTQVELKRLQSLKKSAAFSQARFDDKSNEVVKYRSEVGVQKAAVASAQAEQRLADIDMHNSVIRAPYDGVVSRKNTVAGAYLSVGDAVITMINHTDLEIEADVPSERLNGLEVGRSIGVKLDSGQPMRAIVRALVPDENALTRTRPVRFTPVFNAVGTGQLQLARNQSVTVLVPIGRPRNIVSVHKDAVIPRGGKNIVFVANEGKVNLRAIRLGSAIGNRFEVIEGLGVGDLVVVRGNERLRPGQAISHKGLVKEGEQKTTSLKGKQSSP